MTLDSIRKIVYYCEINLKRNNPTLMYSIRSIVTVIYSLFLITALLSSCSKFSPDEPFPFVYEPALFTASNNKIVYALNPETGDQQWRRSVDGEVHATPVLFDDALWVATTAGTLYKIEHTKGDLIDSIRLEGPIKGTPLPYKNNLLLVPSGNKLFALRTANLESAWTYDMGSPIVSSPTSHNIVNGEQDAIFLSGLGNRVVALNDEGLLLWAYSPATDGAFYSSPCVVNDSFLYVGNDNGNLYALNTFNGSEKWSFATAGQIRSSPIHIGGNVLVGSNDRNFYSVDSATGQLRWKVKTADIIVSSPSVYNQYVYFGSYDNYIYCVDIIDGKVKWKQLTFGLIKASPVIHKGALYLGSFDRNLYKLDAKDGSQHWVRDMYGQMETSAIVDGHESVSVPSINGNYKY